ncbi:hypothetical protein FBQ97_19085 [Acidobacteria bacterium ACD]|nr:MAG: hypothetical protein EDX89_22895 [Acidobacteriota bacterium]MCE7959545.1 hypothetical protein [Acidobacteria bacterium ACB2]MDL1951894.1 hypothetical protein [Acidobacteria bacterium ACD]
MTWPVGESRLFRWDHATSRPRLLVLLLLGWTVEAFDERYGSVLLSHDVATRAARSSGAGKRAPAATDHPCWRPLATVGEEAL